MRKSLLLALSAIVVSCTACSSFEYRPVPALSGMYTYPQADGDGVMKVEINRIRVNSKKVMIFVDLINEGAEEVRFKRAGVTLDYQGKVYQALDFKHREGDVDVLPAETKDKYWAFHVMEKAQGGEYTMSIKGISILRDGDYRPVGLDFTMQIPIPAELNR